jgi:hypothetical protein
MTEREIFFEAIEITNADERDAYLNGEEVHRFEGGRALSLDQDTVRGLSLRQGINPIVLKVANRTGGWGASVRFTQQDGSGLDGVRVTLNPGE